jgi:predicted DNA-binding ribbon-helix-helix protein
MTKSLIAKHSLKIAGHSTSFSLEPPFFDELKRIALVRHATIAELVGEIDKNKAGNLSSAIRLFVLADLKNRA